MSTGSVENVFQLLFERKKPDIDVDLLCLLDNSLGSLLGANGSVTSLYHECAF